MLTTREHRSSVGPLGGFQQGDGPSRALWLATGIVVTIGMLIPVVVSGLLVWSILYAPLSEALPKPRSSVISQITHVYDSRGEQIAVLRSFDTNIPVQASDLPQTLKDAVVAIEDSRFYSHRGVDVRAVFRALWADLTGGGYVQGASTITQQYVRQLYTGNERSLNRKVREVVLAGRLESKLGKDEILHRYLSDAYLGAGAYGVGAAAQTYFRKPVKDLTLAESALLAGLIQAPSRNEPRSNPTGAEARRELVLKEMLDQGRIDSFAYSEALAQPVVVLAEGETTGSQSATFIHPPEGQAATYPYYVDYVRRYLIAKYGEDKVYRGGLRVETALDPALQFKAEGAVAATLEGTAAPLEMGLVAEEPTTGLVKALVGGRDFAKSQVNLALGNCAYAAKAGDSEPICIDGGGSGRQPGSAFKPVTLAAAYEKGIMPDTTYRGPSSYTFPNCSGQGCTVYNSESGSYGSLNLPDATAKSVNTIFAQLIEDVGVKETAEVAHRLGLTMVDPQGNLPGVPGERYGPSLTLGAAEESPLDMAGAYSVFAARGLQFAPTPVVKVVDADGRVLEDNTKRQGKRVLPTAVADNVTEALKGTITSGTGTAADVGRPNGSAGKTGTTSTKDTYTDAWFVGYTPKLAASIWMGYADSQQRPLVDIKGVAKVYGGTWPARTWQAFMAAALDGTPPADFPPPEALRPKVTAPPSTFAAGGFGPGDATYVPPVSTTPSPPTSVTANTIVPPLDLNPGNKGGPLPPLSVPPYPGPSSLPSTTVTRSGDGFLSSPS